METFVDDFERDCERFGLSPTAVLIAASFHKGTWKRWRERTSSPTIANALKARAKLDELIGKRVAA